MPKPQPKVQPPARKSGYAATVQAAANAPQVNTVVAVTFYSLSTAVAQLEQALSLMRAQGMDPVLIAQTEATLDGLKAQLAGMLPPTKSPFN